MSAQFGDVAGTEVPPYSTVVSSFGRYNVRMLFETLAVIHNIDMATTPPTMLPNATRPSSTSTSFLLQPLFADIITVPAFNSAPNNPSATSAEPYLHSPRLTLSTNGYAVWFELDFVDTDFECLKQHNATWVLPYPHQDGLQEPSTEDLHNIQYSTAGGDAILACTRKNNLDPDVANGPNNFVTLSRPESSSFLADNNFSLTTLYTVLIYAIATSVRGIFQGIAQRIVFEEMEVVDKPISICVHVSRAREVKNYKLEHDLYLYLIDLFRQPQKLYHATTRPPPRPNKLWPTASLPENRPPPLALVESYPPPAATDEA